MLRLTVLRRARWRFASARRAFIGSGSIAGL
jgi:hypothetical protein